MFTNAKLIWKQSVRHHLEKITWIVRNIYIHIRSIKKRWNIHVNRVNDMTQTQFINETSGFKCSNIKHRYTLVVFTFWISSVYFFVNSECLIPKYWIYALGNNCWMIWSSWNVFDLSISWIDQCTKTPDLNNVNNIFDSYII